MSQNDGVFVYTSSYQLMNMLEQEEEMITHVKIHESVTRIEGSFESFVNLRRVDFHRNITFIGLGCFEQCKYLEQVSNLPENLVEMEGFAFRGCGIRKLVIPPRIKKIPEECFADCFNLEYVKLPEGLEYIDCKAFKNCAKLQRVAIPSTVKISNLFDETTHDCSWFLGCQNLSLVSLPETLLKIPAWTFRDCSKLEFIALKEGLEEIDRGAFMNSGLKSIAIPSSVKSIGNLSTGEVFQDCKWLTSVTLPEGLRLIPVNTFKGCVSLTSITLPETIERICAGAFADCRSLVSMTIKSKHVQSVDQGAFSGCVNLRTIRATPQVLSLIHGGMEHVSDDMCTMELSL